MTEPKEEKKDLPEEVQEQEKEQHPETTDPKEEDPHRGITDTPSQHTALLPEGERNNDDEYYDEDGALDEELDDLDDLNEEEH